MVDDPDAYAVYAAVLNRPFSSGDKPLSSFVLLEETRSQSNCQTSDRVCPEWNPIWKAYQQANAVVRFLRSDGDLGLPYRLVPLATARELLLKAGYDGKRVQGGWSSAYASFPNNKLLAVSSVGFDPSKTRAIVAVQYNCGLSKESVIRDYDCHGGRHELLIKQERRWVSANIPSCAWMASRQPGPHWPTGAHERGRPKNNI